MPVLRCQICKRRLDNPADPIRSKDCGGDCCECMAILAYDPDCYALLHAMDPVKYPKGEET